MSLSPERAGRLTASIFASAMGISPYSSRQKLWREIKGIDPKFEGNEMTEYGNDNEQNAVDAYESNQRVIVTASGNNQQFMKHPEHDWLGCTPDGFTLERLVEFKCPFVKMYDDAPISYIAQVMGQMAITGRKQADLAAWTPDELRVWRIEFSDEYWGLQLELLQEFWAYVQGDIEPKRRKKPVMPDVHYELLF
jgi:putative phage-type endonuclease